MSIPNISKVNYNASLSTLKVTGSHLTPGIALDMFTLKTDTNSYTLNPNDDLLSNFSANGFTVTLGNAGSTAVNAFFNTNAANSYQFSANGGWDAGSGDPITSVSVTVSGNISLAGITANAMLTDVDTIHPFTKLTITDPNPKDGNSSHISFPQANGFLYGSGLSAGVVTGDVITYTLLPATPADLQKELRNLEFSPTLHQTTPGQSVSTTFSLTVEGSTLITPSLTLSDGISRPSSIAIDDKGNLFIANKSGDTVEKFSPDGKLLLKYTTDLSSPSSLAVDSQGNLFVANYNNSTIEKFDASGTWQLTQSAHVSHPESLTIDANGNVLIANYGGNTIEVFDVDGNWLRAISAGVSRPQYVTTDSDGNIFVANVGDNTVVELDAAGNGVQKFSDGIRGPQFVTTDSNGNVFVANGGNNTVEKFSASGELLFTLSQGISNPKGLALDSHGNLFVANYYNDTVEEFSPSGNLLLTYTNGLSGPTSLAIDSHDNLFVSNNNSNTIKEFAPLLPTNPVIAVNTDTHITVTAAESATLTSASYDAASGKLTLKGAHLTASTSDYTPWYLSVTGQDGVSEALSGNILAKPTDTQVVLKLDSYSQQSLGGILNHDGTTAIDGTAYKLSAGSNWDKGAVAFSNLEVSVTHVIPPTLSTASYDAITGTLNVTGSHLVKLDQNSIALGKLSLNAGGNHYTLNADIDSLANFSDKGFSVTLNDADRMAVNALFNSNGNKSGSSAYTLSAAEGWDSGSGSAIAGQKMTVSGNLALSGISANASLTDTGTIQPFAKLTLANPAAIGKESADISFTADNGSLSGNGLSDGVIDHGVIHYHLSATDPAALQQALQNLVFTPTAHQVAAGNKVATDFTLDITGNTNVISSVAGMTLDNGAESPCSMASDSAGNVFVAYTDANLVREFSASGVLLKTLDSNNGILAPKDIVTDRNGNLYVANYNNDTVEKFSPSGELLLTLSDKLTSPGSIAIDSKGNVYVANQDGNSVEKFSAGGDWLQTLTKGIASPAALTVDSKDNLFVANNPSTNQSVEEFSASGALMRTLTQGISDPEDLAIDGKGNLYVVNTGKNTVEEFSPKGALIRTLTSTNGIHHPQSVVLDSHGDLFVANAYGTVMEYSASGTQLQSLINGIDSPTSLALDSDGNLLVADKNFNKIVKVYPTTLTINNTGTHITVTGTPNPAVTTVGYDAATGKLTITGKNLTPAATDYVPSDLTLSGQNGLHYTLTGGTVNGKPSATKVIINLSDADQLAVNGLLSNGGGSYSFSAISGWDKGAPPIDATTMTVSKLAAPTLTAASYNIATGALTISGTHLANLDGNNGIAPGAFTLHAGSQSYSLTADSVELSNAGTKGFTLTLNNDAKLALNALFNVNGNSYSLSVGSGWDTVNSTAVDAKTVSVSGNIDLNGFTADTSLNDTASLKPFASLTIGDSNSKASDGASISFTAANGSLSGTGLSVGVIDNDIVTYSLSATNPAALQQELRNLVFTPTKHQVAEGNSVDTNFTLTVTGTPSAPAFASDASTHVTVTATPGPRISGADYDAAAGTLTLNGAHLTTSASDYLPANIALTGQNGLQYTLAGGTMAANPTANQAVINLSNADRLALNALLNLDGTQASDASIYNLSAVAGWDKEASAIESQALTVIHTSDPTLTGASYDAATGILSVSGAHLAKFGNDLGLSLANFSLSAGSKSLSLNPATDTLGDIGINGFSVTLGADDKTAVNAFFNNNGIKSDISAYTLSATSAWDAGQGAAIAAQSITVNGNAGGISLDGFASSISLFDTDTTHLFSTLTVADGNPNRGDSATISFATANGTLSGNGLSVGVINGSTISYTLSPTTPSSLQQELRNLLFTPTPHQAAVGQTVATEFNLTIDGKASVLKADPTWVTAWGVGHSIAVDSHSGNLVAANRNANTVSEYSSMDTLLWTSTAAGKINTPVAVAVDNNGNVFIANKGNGTNGTVEEFSASGTWLREMSIGNANSYNMVTDSSGNLYVSGAALEKFSPTGDLLPTSFNFLYPSDIAIDSKDNLFVLASNMVKKFSSTGEPLLTISDGINSPRSIAIDNNGNLFVANSMDVKEFSASGVLLRTLSSGLNGPNYLTTDSNGNVFIVNNYADSNGNFTLEEFSSDGILMQTVTIGTYTPLQAAIDANGNVFVCDMFAKIEEFSPAFTTTASVTYLSSKATVTATANHFNVSPNADLNHATSITGAHAGDTITIADATGFVANPISAANVSGTGGDPATLKGWVDAALSGQGGNLASHEIAWFNFGGDTYLVEQANSQGSAYGAGDTLIQLVGSFDESSASFSGHSLTL